MIGPLPPGRRPRTVYLSSGLLLLIVAGYAYPLLARRNFTGGDPLGYHYAIEKAVHDAYARGRLPVWISDVSGGRPLLANPNAGALYPIRPLLSLLPFPVAARIFPILHWALGGIGMMFLLRGIHLSAAGVWIGAVTYVFSAVSVAEAQYPNIHPGMALLPWSLVALRRLSQLSWTGVVGLSVVWALFLLVGDAFSIALGFFASVLWILTEVAPEKRVVIGGRLLTAMALAALAAAPQVLATIFWIPQSHRGVLGMRIGEALLFSISPFRLFEFLIPFPFGDTWDIDATRIWGVPVFHNRTFGLFPSLYAGAFAFVAVFIAWKSTRAGARFGRYLLVAGLAVCVLPSLVPPALSRFHSPIPLRYPEKFAVALVLALSILAAIAVESRLGGARRLRWPFPVGIGLALLALAASLWPATAGRVAAGSVGAPEYAATAAAQFPGALAEAGLFWMATVVAVNALESGTRRGLLFSLSILTAVPIAAGRRVAQSSGEELIFSPPPFARVLQRSDPDRRFRTLPELVYDLGTSLPRLLPSTVITQIRCHPKTWALFTPALWDRGTVFGADFDAGDLSRMETLRRLATLAASSPVSRPFFGSLGLRWGIRYRDREPLAGYRRFGGDGYSDWDEHSRPYPDIRLLESWREETGALPAVTALQRLGDGEVVIESGTRLSGSARPGRVHVLENTPERLRVETRAPDPTWLFVLRGYWNSRTILLDGTPVEDSPAQIAFSAVPVPAGLHRIEWSEDVPGWSVSRWGPLLFLVSCVWIARRHPRSTPGARDAPR